jgi:hypothetical protein
MYRVWTKDINGKYTVHTDWATRRYCKKVIYGRWGHWPPFAFISKAKTLDWFIRVNGV